MPVELTEMATCRLVAGWALPLMTLGQAMRIQCSLWENEQGGKLSNWHGDALATAVRQGCASDCGKTVRPWMRDCSVRQLVALLSPAYHAMLGHWESRETAVYDRCHSC